MTYTVLFYAVVDFGRERKELYRLLFLLLLANLLALCLLFCQFFLNHFNQAEYLFSLSEKKMFSKGLPAESTYFLTASSFYYAALFFLWQKRYLLPTVALLSVNLYLLYLSYQRAGILAMAVVVMVPLFFCRGSITKRLGVTASLVLALFLLLMTTPIKSKFIYNNWRQTISGQFLDHPDSSDSVHLRLGIQWYFLQYFKEHLLVGVGYGKSNLRKVDVESSQPRPGGVIHAHNVFFDFALQTGLQGLAAYLLLLFAQFRVAVQGIKRSTGRFDRFVFTAALCFMSGFWVRMQFDDVYRSGTALAYWLITALTVSLWSVISRDCKTISASGSPLLNATTACRQAMPFQAAPAGSFLKGTHGELLVNSDTYKESSIFHAATNRAEPSERPGRCLMATRDGKITILHVLSSFKGDYPLFTQVIRGLSDGYRHIVCYLAGPAADSETLGRDGYEVKWLPFTRDELKGFRLQVVRELDRIIKAEGVDIVHAQRHKSVFYAALAVRKNGRVRLVTTVHGLKRSRSLLRRLGNRLLWPSVSKIIAVSEAVKDDILQANSWFPADRVEVVYNGINLERFVGRDLDSEQSRACFGLPAQGWLWGAVGRLAQVKGHDILLRAWAAHELGKRGAYLAIAGIGEQRARLLSLAQELGIAGEIVLLGQVSDIPGFLSALDGFVMPSRHEGFGLAMVEALAAGLPVVASRVGGMPEILSPLAASGYCFLVPSEKETELAEAMGQVMRWPAAYREQAACAIRQQAQRFNASRMIARLDFIYRNLVAD